MPYKDPSRHREAAKKATAAWRKRNPEKVKAIQNAFYARNREKYRRVAREWYHANKDQAQGSTRRGRLRVLYGITPEQYEALGSACAICGATEDSRIHGKTKKPFRLAVDHCHDTKKIRGLLCGNCNCGVGYFKHDAQLLAKAIAYLERED